MGRRKIESAVALAKFASDFPQNSDRVRKSLLCDLAFAGTNGSVANASANPPYIVASAGGFRQRKNTLNKAQHVAIVNPTIGQDLGQGEPASKGHNQGAIRHSLGRRIGDSVPARTAIFPPQEEAVQFDLDPR